MTLIRALFTFLAAGYLGAVACLIHTSPISMMAFFMIGLPSFLIALVLYLYLVFRDLKRHKVF